MRRGRPFSAEEDRPGRPLLPILDSFLWRTRFHADPDVVTKPISLTFGWQADFWTR